MISSSSATGSSLNLATCCSCMSTGCGYCARHLSHVASTVPVISKSRMSIVSCLSSSTLQTRLAFFTSEYSNWSKKASVITNSNWCFPSLRPVKGIENSLSDFNEQQLARKCRDKFQIWKVFFGDKLPYLLRGRRQCSLIPLYLIIGEFHLVILL